MDPEAYKKHNKPETGAAPGVYKHPNTNEELHAATFPAADAFVRQGWVYDRPLPPAEERRTATESEPALSADKVKKLREELKAEKEARKAAEAAADEAKAEAGAAMKTAEEAEKAQADAAKEAEKEIAAAKKAADEAVKKAKEEKETK